MPFCLFRHPERFHCLAEMSLDKTLAEQPGEEHRMQHLSRLEQEAADYRQHPSIQSAPETVTQKLRYQYQDLSDKHLGQEALTFSSSAPAHLMSHLPPVRTSIPLLLQQQVRRDSQMPCVYCQYMAHPRICLTLQAACLFADGSPSSACIPGDCGVNFGPHISDILPRIAVV